MNGSDACLLLVVFTGIMLILSLITCVIIAWIYGSKAARIARDITANKLENEIYRDSYRDYIIEDILKTLQEKT